MEELIRQLITVHQKLYDLALQKTEAIKIGDAQAVGRLAQQEGPLIDKAGLLERKRAEEVRKDVPSAAEEPTFREWENEAVPEADRSEWHELYLELANTVLLLKRVNQLNQDLLRQSLQWVKLSMNLLQPQIQPNNYGNPRGGQLPPARFSGRIDSRA